MSNPEIQTSIPAPPESPNLDTESLIPPPLGTPNLQSDSPIPASPESLNLETTEILPINPASTESPNLPISQNMERGTDDNEQPNQAAYRDGSQILTFMTQVTSICCCRLVLQSVIHRYR